MIDTVDRLADTQAAIVVSVGIGVCTLYHVDKVTILSPSKGIAGAVVVAQGVAGGIVGNGLPVESRQQVSPVGIAAGASVGICPIQGRGVSIARPLRCTLSGGLWVFPAPGRGEIWG